MIFGSIYPSSTKTNFDRVGPPLTKLSGSAYAHPAKYGSMGFSIGGVCYACAIRICLPIYLIWLYTLRSKSNLPLSLDTILIFSRECSKTSASKMHEMFDSCSRMCYLHFWILQTLCFWQTITQVIYFLSFAVVRLEGCNVVSRVCFSLNAYLLPALHLLQLLH